jgi:hypothetical protein
MAINPTVRTPTSTPTHSEEESSAVDLTVSEKITRERLIPKTPIVRSRSTSILTPKKTGNGESQWTEGLVIRQYIAALPSVLPFEKEDKRVVTSPSLNAKIYRQLKIKWDADTTHRILSRQVLIDKAEEIWKVKYMQQDIMYLSSFFRYLNSSGDILEPIISRLNDLRRYLYATLRTKGEWTESTQKLYDELKSLTTLEKVSIPHLNLAEGKDVATFISEINLLKANHKNRWSAIKIAFGDHSNVVTDVIDFLSILCSSTPHETKVTLLGLTTVAKSLEK